MVDSGLIESGQTISNHWDRKMTGVNIDMFLSTAERLTYTSHFKRMPYRYAFEVWCCFFVCMFGFILYAAFFNSGTWTGGRKLSTVDPI